MHSSFQVCKKQLDGVLSIDYFLAKRLCQTITPDSDPNLLFHSIMATSQALRDGHSCLKLAEEAEKPYWTNPDDDKMGFQFPGLDEWHQYLSKAAISPENNHPVVYEHKRLYLRRYWQFEDELGRAIRQLIQQPGNVDLSQGRKVIDQLFPTETDTHALDWQKIAVANALGQQFSIIAGGPGTGKTFTVTKILAALQALSNNALRIAMVAPTGKAAQRLNESIQKAKAHLKQNKLASEETLNNIPDSASTLHRMLKVKMGSHNFRYHANNLLPFDVILVDEISMIDLPLMARLMRACNPTCRIVMLGDADQLPSVAAGSVLADLAPQQTPGYSLKNSKQLSELTGFNIPLNNDDEDNLTLDHLTTLQHSHRFEGGGEIGQLAKDVINGKTTNSWDLLAQGKTQIECVQSKTMRDWVIKMIEQYYVPLFTSGAINTTSVMDAFNQLNRFRFLAATRMGEQGVTQINETIEHYLRSKGFITGQSEFYPGRPIMVTENHYHVGLYNGDIGILWKNENGKLAAAFPQNNDQINDDENSPDTDSVRWLSLGRLPAVETVYAMTIHKTQGSEFNHVALILPEHDSLILSRELLYTGITRASDQLSIWSNKSTWTTTVKRKVQRYSGLGERVFGVD